MNCSTATSTTSATSATPRRTRFATIRATCCNFGITCRAGIRRPRWTWRSIDALRIRGFLAFLFEREKKKTSIARKLAAVRAFYKFLAKEGVLAANPAATVSTPKLDKTLPRIMTEEEMNNFLDRVAEAVQSGEPMMRRDRAILELLYASGLRVSELAGLDLRSVNFGDGMLLVRGKGRKERIVPFGSKAKQALDDYLPVRERVLMEAKKSGQTALFLNTRGRPADHPLRRSAAEEIRAHLRTECEGQPALDAARLRFPLAHRGRRPARHPGNARAPEPCHHAEIHAGVDQATDRCLRQDASEGVRGGARSQESGVRSQHRSWELRS